MSPLTIARNGLFAGLTLFLATAAVIIPGKAQNTSVIEIRGTAENVQLRLENAPLATILGELSRRFNVTYGISSVQTFNRQLSGRYSGTLNQVLARLLDGSDYILESTDQRVNIVIVNASSPSLPVGAKPVASGTTGQSAPADVPASENSRLAADPVGAAAPQVPPLSSFLSR